MKDLPTRIFLPVRLFHAWVTGIVLGTLLSLGVFQIQQKLFASTSIANFRGNGWSTYVPPSQAGMATGTHAPTTDDEDGDEIPNSWETSYSHNPQIADDAAYDFDFDALTEKQEYDLSVRTNGAYGNPLGKYKTVTIPAAPGFTSISTMTLIESAKNGTSLFSISGVASGQSTTRILTYSPVSNSWTRVTPPGNYSNVTLYATDINSQGQVVGSFYSGTYKGYCWTPDNSGGGSSQEFVLNSPGSPPAIPKRISDTGYLLYSTPGNGTLKAADPKRRPIDPIYNSWTTPEFTDVNDMGEYVGTIPDLLTWEYVTFLAIPGGPLFLTALSANDAGGWSPISGATPDIDPSQINWVSIDCYDLDGNWIYPEDLGYYSEGEVVDSDGNPVDPAYFENQFGTAAGSSADFRRAWGSNEIWWGWGNGTWEFFYTTTAPTAALNDWGEFAGPYSANWLNQSGSGAPYNNQTRGNNRGDVQRSSDPAEKSQRSQIQPDFRQREVSSEQAPGNRNTTTDQRQAV